MRSRSDELVRGIDVASVRHFIAAWRRADGGPATPSPGEQADLMALAWLGCGLYAVPEWREARFEADAARCERSWSNLVETPALVEWLEAGLTLLRTPPLLH